MATCAIELPVVHLPYQGDRGAEDLVLEINRVLLGSYTADQLRRGLQPSSVARRQYSLAGLAKRLDDRNILEARRVDIEEWLDSRDLSTRTRCWHLSNLSSFFRWAIREEWLDIDPTARIVRPRSRRLVPRPISENDLARALSEADDRMRCWLMLAAYQGFRAKEIASLRREDLLDTHRPPLLVVESGKGGHQRVLPLNLQVQRALHSYGLPRQGYLWSGQRGPIQAATVSRYVSRYLHGLGIPATAHQGRHYFASTVYQQTKDLRLVQELLGHSHPSTTAIYTQWSPSAASAVVRDLGLSSDQWGGREGPGSH